MRKKKLFIVALIGLIGLGGLVGVNYPKMCFYWDLNKTFASETAGEFELRIETIELDQSLGQLVSIPLLTTHSIGPLSMDGHYFFDTQTNQSGLAISLPRWLSNEEIEILKEDRTIYLSLDNLGILSKTSATSFSDNLGRLMVGEQADNPYQDKFLQIEASHKTETQAAQVEPKQLLRYLLRLPAKKFVKEQDGQRLQLTKTDSEKLITSLTVIDEQKRESFFRALADLSVEVFIDDQSGSCQLLIEGGFSESFNHVKSISLSLTIYPDKESQRTIKMPTQDNLMTVEELKQRFPLLNLAR